jgi:putative membrane protein
MKWTITRTVALAAALVFSVSLMTMRAQLADDFVGDLARGNMAEISLSQMALQRSQSEAVKQFAQMMVTDHTAAGTELQTLATSKNITLPTAMDQKHQSAMTKLGGESGAAFDRDYMKQMVNDHEKTLSLLQKQADKGTDADLKAFAAKMVPIVQGHLTAARNLSGTLGNGGNSSKMSSANNGMSSGNSGMNNMNSTRNSNSNTRRSGNTSNSNSNRRTNTNTGNTNGNTNGNSNGNSNRE